MRESWDQRETRRERERIQSLYSGGLLVNNLKTFAQDDDDDDARNGGGE